MVLMLGAAVWTEAAGCMAEHPPENLLPEREKYTSIQPAGILAAAAGM
jgi:hypothetical protein